MRRDFSRPYYLIDRLAESKKGRQQIDEYLASGSIQPSSHAGHIVANWWPDECVRIHHRDPAGLRWCWRPAYCHTFSAETRIDGWGAAAVDMIPPLTSARVLEFD